MREGLVQALTNSYDEALPDELKARVARRAQPGLVEFIDSWNPNFRNYLTALANLISELKSNDSMASPPSN